MSLDRIKKILESISFSKGVEVIYNDPKLGDIKATISKDSQSYEDTVQIKIKGKLMYVRKDSLKLPNEEVIL